MDETEQAFRDALRRGAQTLVTEPLDPEELVALSAAPGAGPGGWQWNRWLAGAAAVVLVAGVGLGVWAVTGRGAELRAVPAATPRNSVSVPTGSPGTESPGPSQPLPTPSADPLIANTRALPDAPAVVRDNTGRVNCGQVILGLGEEVSTESLECLSRFLGMEGVELVVAEPTDEGDPIVTFFIGTPGSSMIDAYTSSHWDKFGPDVWTHRQCGAVAATSFEELRVCS